MVVKILFLRLCGTISAQHCGLQVNGGENFESFPKVYTTLYAMAGCLVGNAPAACVNSTVIQEC